MKRAFLAVIAMALAVMTIGPNIEIGTQAEDIFPSDRTEFPTLDDAPSREVVIIFSHADLKHRNALARSIAQKLAKDPLVEKVMFSANAASEEFQAWVWDNRFHLAPPEAIDFDPTRMATYLKEAVEYFSDFNSMVHGDRLLLDPTGSYRRIIQTLETPGSKALTEADGVWQTYDQKSAVLRILLADRPFNATETQAFATSIRHLSEQKGVTAQILGVRIIAAETTLFNTKASTRASTLAAILLLCWLMWALRSFTATFYAFLPVALGLTAAFTAVTLIFGAVHIVAIAFGGVLLGLALDYPIHVMGHPRQLHPKAHRLIFLGATTTGISFLAMIGSQVPALVQTGVFILVGLTVSAFVTIAAPCPKVVKIRGLPLHRLSVRLPAKAAIEYALAVLGIITILAFGKETPITLFEPPQHIRTEIREIGVKLNLPSSKFAIDVSGRTMTELLQNERQLSKKLDQEIEKGNLQSYNMLAQLLPSNKPSFASPEVFHANVQAALAQVGLAARYSKQQLEAYEHALQVPAISNKDLAGFPETADLAKRLKINETGWHERVQIVLPIGKARPNFTINSTHAEMVDLLAPLQTSMTDLKTQISFWLLTGLICGLAVLALGLRSLPQTLRIFRTSCAVLGASTGLLIMLYGSLSIFHIVAMALVLGIGVDYSIILAGLKNKDKAADTSATSVYVCAISTLIAFTILALSQVQILHQIGTTVVIGLLLMLFLTLAKTGSVEE